MKSMRRHLFIIQIKFHLLENSFSLQETPTSIIGSGGIMEYTIRYKTIREFGEYSDFVRFNPFGIYNVAKIRGETRVIKKADSKNNYIGSKRSNTLFDPLNVRKKAYNVSTLKITEKIKRQRYLPIYGNNEVKKYKKRIRKQ